MASMKAGVATRDLSPHLGVELGGYPYVERRNTGIHDPLVVAALHLNSDGEQILLLATDLFWITRAQAELIRTRLGRELGLAAERILVTCSHTHSAPWMGVVFEGVPGRPFDTPLNENYIAAAIDACVEAGVAATAETFEAALGFALASCGEDEGIGGNRRLPFEGVVDTDVPILVVADANETIRAVWTKYALHPTILHGDNTLVSADFPGAMRKVVESALPEATFLYSMGTAGDQSPRFFRHGQTFEEVERFGNTLGGTLLTALPNVEWYPSARIALRSRGVDLPVKSYPAPAVAAGKVRALEARVSDLTVERAAYTDLQTAKLWLLGAECDYANAVQATTGRLRTRYDEGVPYSVTALAIGDTAWVFLPGEVFCEFGVAIKQASPWPTTVVVTLTNGHLPGYCVTQEALAEGGYEPGNSILAASAGAVLVETAVDLLHHLHEGNQD